MTGSNVSLKGSTPLKLHKLSFLRDEWERLVKNAEDTGVSFAPLEFEGFRCTIGDLIQTYHKEA